MRWRRLLRASDGLTHVHEQILQVLDLDRQLLERADMALTGPADDQPDPVAATIDTQARDLIRHIHRRLVVHGAIHMSSSDVPTMLAQAGVREHLDTIRDEAGRLVQTAAAVARAGNSASGTELHQHTEQTLAALKAARDAYARQEAPAATTSRQDDSAQTWDNVLHAAAGRDQGTGPPLLVRYHEGLRRIEWHTQRILASLSAASDASAL